VALRAHRHLRQGQGDPRLRSRLARRLNAMKILFTGASSFTGYWFVQALAKAGHEVTATFRRRPEEYEDEVRRVRAGRLAEVLTAKPLFGVSFGDDAFLETVRKGSFELLCHHAADVRNYR